MTTEEFLAESVAAAQSREQAAFDELVFPAEGRIVLFGAGVLGRKVLAALRRRGMEPLAFADNNPALSGASVEGIPVFSLIEAASRWRQDALFVVTIFHPPGDDGLASRMQRLKDLGCRWTASFLPLAWRLGGVLPHFGADLPSRLLAHAEALKRVGGLWQDEISREIYRQQLAWRLRGDFSGPGAPAPDQYFPRDLIRPREGEVLVDGGAFDGDTLRGMPWKFGQAWAIEPDPSSAAKLRTLQDARVKICETALGSAPGRVRFNASGTMAAARSDAGDIEVQVSMLDELLAGESPTLLKLDVEGDELAALQGGRRMLQRSRPVVAVCVYHRPEDLWTIPLFLHEVLPEHRLFLRSHAHDGFELVAYAVPVERCAGQTVRL